MGLRPRREKAVDRDGNPAKDPFDYVNKMALEVSARKCFREARPDLAGDPLYDPWAEAPMFVTPGIARRPY